MLFLKRFFGYGLLFTLALQVFSISPQMVNLAIASLDPSPQLGNPPYVWDASKLSVATKAALRKFPMGVRVCRPLRACGTSGPLKRSWNILRGQKSIIGMKHRYACSMP